MADEQIQGISAFLDSVLHPNFVESFRPEGPELQLQIFNGSKRAFEPHTLRSIFPFTTLQDVKLAIYSLMRQEDKALPAFTFIARKSKFGGKLQAVDYQWVDSVKPKDHMRLPDPIEQVAAETEVNRKFVESSGERRLLGLTDKSRLLVEEGLKGVDTLYVFFYEDLAALSDVVKPFSEMDWNGRFWAYFPALSVGADRPTAEQRAQARRAARAATVRRQFFARLEESLAAGEPLLPIALTGIRYLRLTFPKPAEIPGIEPMFYDIPVSDRRPYMRLMPASGTPISKVHLLPSGRPNLDDPRLLVQWSQERSPTPERDYALAKILYRKASGSISPLFFTLRLLDDGTADITIETPRGVRRLDPTSELGEAPRVIAEGLQGLPYLQTVPQLGTGVFIFGLSVKGLVSEPFTTKSLRDRLGIFKPIFQEIPPLPGDTPLLMIRYKLVNNFFTEDRVGMFISQQISRRLVRGDALLTELVEVVAEEFQLEMGEARRRVAAYLQDRGEVMAVDMESKEYQFNSNAGVDIAVFAQHPLYAFHIYRVDSVLTLQRVITFLSMLFTREPAELRVPEEAVRALDAVEEEEQEDAEEEAAAAASNAENEVEGEFQFEEEDVEESAPYPPDREATAEAMPDYLQDFMFNAAALNQDQAAVEEDAAAAAAVPAPAAEVPLPVSTSKERPLPSSNNIEKEEAAGKFKGSYEDFFSIKLKEADRALFDYHKSHPSSKKYVTQCGSNLMRQPAVLNQAQYERMMDEYEPEIAAGEAVFYLFPLDKDKKKEPYEHAPGAEYYTIMRYGTSQTIQNYYLCCRYFCTRDYMLVREKDLLGTKLRRPVPQADGSVRTDKAPGVCPFCEGKVIKNRQYPGVNEVVLERIVKPGTLDKRHLYIKFLGKVYHPDGFHLPCCFTDDQPVRIGHPAFPEATTAVPKRAVADLEAEEDAEAAMGGPEGPAADAEEGAADLVSYEETLKSIKYAYIIGAEKFPLEGPRRKFAKIREGAAGAAAAPKAKIVPPQIGLLPSVLNSFFGQDPAQLVSRTFNPQKVKPGAQGFLRIGVENRSRFKADSFLAAAAPFFGMNSAAAFKGFLEKLIQPRVFMAMNYGNFLLEMYDAAKGRPKPEEAGIVREWGRTALGQRRVMNQELLVRAFMAYRSFQDWLASEDTVKEYRQFAHLFSLPGLLATATRRYTETGEIVAAYRRPGILFIVLDILKSGEVRVRCPPYPVSQDAMARADIGFLAHHWTGVWEPLFYVDNRTLGERDLHTFFLAFSSSPAQKDRWPPIVKQRVEEFSKSCATLGGARGIYTSQSGIHSTRILPVSDVRKQLAGQEGIVLHGLVRDAYNHVAALVYQIKEYPAPNLVAVPVVDDGIALLDVELVVYLDWDEFEPAPIDAVVNFYRNYIEYPKFPRTYMPRAAVRSRGTDQFSAVRLEIGIFVPVAETAEIPETLELPSQEEEVDEMEWMINKKLAMGSVALEESSVPVGDEARLRAKEFNETYEHLRLTFSNWLASIEDGGEFRRALEALIFRRDLPLFEKRKRMEILLGAEIESWLYEADEDAPRQATLLRVDCRLRDEGECSGMCEWRTDEKQCLLHVPATAPAEGMVASGARVLLLRLIDELLRHAGRRQQIFEKRVRQMSILENPIRMRDQYIVPEKSAAWVEMLRLEWAHDKTEEARYLEEMSRLPGIGDQPTTTVAEDTYEAPAPGLPPGIFVEPPAAKDFKFTRKAAPAATPAMSPGAPAAAPPKQFAFKRPAEAASTTTAVAQAPAPKQYQFKRPGPPKFTKEQLEALSELPAILKARFGPDDPKTSTLRLYPSPTGTVGPFLGLFGLYPEDIGQAPRATEFTDEEIKALVRKSRVPMVQYDLRADPPTVIAKRLATERDAKGYPVIVLRTDAPPSLLVLNPEAPAALTKADLPAPLFREFAAGVKLFGIKLSE